MSRKEEFFAGPVLPVEVLEELYEQILRLRRKRFFDN